MQFDGYPGGGYVIDEPLGNGGEDILWGVFGVEGFAANFFAKEAAEAAAKEIPEIPNILARVVAGEGPFTSIGAPGAADAFVTDPAAIAGLNPEELAQKLTIDPSDTYTIIQFPTPEEGLASPVFRDNPGFLQGGFTSGGAPEWVVPNGPIPSNSIITTVGPG